MKKHLVAVLVLACLLAGTAGFAQSVEVTLGGGFVGSRFTPVEGIDVTYAGFEILGEVSFAQLPELVLAGSYLQ